MKRIAFVIGQLGLGGAEKQLCQLVTGLQQWDYRPLVISLSQGGEWEDYLRAHGIETFALPRRRSFDTKRLRKVVSLLQDFQPEIVHGFDHGGSIYGRLAGYIARVPTLIGGVRCQLMPSKKVLYAERILRPKTAAVISNSEAGKRVWVREVGYTDEQVAVIPNGFNFSDMQQLPTGFRPLRELLNLPGGVPVIGCIGTICERKNPFMFLDVAASMVEDDSKAHFVWIGGGIMRDEFERAIDERGLRSVVHVLGSRGDAAWLAQDFQIGVLTSHDEGLPNAIMEYMYWGLPLITTDAGGCSELVKHERTGFVVEKSDTASMVKYLRQFLRDRVSARQMGQRGKERLAESYLPDVMIGRTVSIYEEVSSERVNKGRVTSASSAPPAPSNAAESITRHFGMEVDAFDEGYSDLGQRYHLIKRRDIILEEFERTGTSPTDGPWLEAGCGAGLLACSLASKGFRVFGLDISPGMIKRSVFNAHRLDISHLTDFQVGDLSSLPFESSSLGGIVCSGVIEYIPHAEAVFAEFRRVLRPGAPLIVSFNNARSPFRWLSGPAKRLPRRLIGYQQSRIRNRAYAMPQVQRLFAQNDLSVTSWRWHTYAFQVKSFWFPPLPLAHMLEVLSKFAPLRWLAWGIIVVGRRDGSLV